MDHKLENDELRIVVNEVGAELQSITSVRTGEEYLWHGDPNIWSGRSPLLFPIVGSLKDSLLKHNGESYSLPRHGLARRASFNTVKSDDHSLEFELRSNANTLVVFPWQFCLTVCYALRNNRVEIEYRVQSLDDQRMRFAIGAHPAFSLPLDQSSIDNFAIAFNADTELDSSQPPITWGIWSSRCLSKQLKIEYSPYSLCIDIFEFNSPLEPHTASSKTLLESPTNKLISSA